jgi:methylmalonyl-CoA/ethylmalonyl-CoA epimerase
MTKQFCLAISILWATTGLGAGAQDTPKASAPTVMATVMATAEARPVWVGVSAGDAEASAKWYQEKLGFHFTRKMDLPEHKLRIVFLELNGFTLELVEFRGSISFQTVQSRIPELKDRDHLRGFQKVGFQVKDVDALAAELKRNGVKLLMEPTDDREFHDRFLMLTDPDGNVLQFFQKMN